MYIKLRLPSATTTVVGMILLVLFELFVMLEQLASVPPVDVAEEVELRAIRWPLFHMGGGDDSTGGKVLPVATIARPTHASDATLRTNPIDRDP